MTTRERIEADFVKEMKARNETAVSTLRMLRASLKNIEIEKMKPLEEGEIIDAIGKELKKLRDALESFAQGKREDLVQKTRQEIAFLETYLPQQLSEDELRSLVQEKIKAAGAVTAKDFGKIMAEVMKDVKGRAEGGKISLLIKEMLT